MKLWRTAWSSVPFAMDLGLFIARLAMGILMMTHGWSKFSNYAERAEKFSDPLGVTPPVSLGLVIFAELFCALFLAVGLFTRLALIPLIINMAVISFVIHGADPFAQKEKALLYLFAYVALFFTGPGAYSLDRMMKR